LRTLSPLSLLFLSLLPCSVHLLGHDVNRLRLEGHVLHRVLRLLDQELGGVDLAVDLDQEGRGQERG